MRGQKPKIPAAISLTFRKGSSNSKVCTTAETGDDLPRSTPTRHPY